MTFSTILLALASASLGIWLYLLAARGGFWLCRERDEGSGTPLPAPWVSWPRIVAVIPARDEAAGIAAAISSLLRQDYPGPLSIVLVDDDSRDGTATLARKTAEAMRAGDRLTVIAGRPLPAGWTGKLWAMKQGIDAANRTAPDHVLLTDADIVYAPDALAKLVARAHSHNLVLASLMVKLRCETLAERVTIPAFIFFFQMLYPFAWVNSRQHKLAAAAGGCMLVRPQALQRAGGIETIRGALIDDCSLAAKMKEQGAIWLGLTDRARSIRPYPKFADIRRMVARSAYAQLRYSVWLLAGTITGMALTYLAPPLLAVLADGLARWLGLAAWLLMAIAFQPTLRFYRMSPLWGAALPLIALIYLVYTFDSALAHWRGRGGAWKGRVQAHVAEQG